MAAGDYVQVYSDPVLSQLVAKLALPRIRKKYSIDGSVIEATLAVIALRGELVVPTRKLMVCRDPKDDLLIEAAVAGNAEYVVSGDEDLLVLKKFEQVRFVTPRAFLEALDNALTVRLHFDEARYREWVKDQTAPGSPTR